MFSFLYDYKEHIVLDNGVGNSRKLIWLGSIDISSSTRNSLLGFHAFTGNDYVSSLFKVKVFAGKFLQRYSNFESPLSVLDNTVELEDDLFRKLEEFVVLHLWISTEVDQFSSLYAVKFYCIKPREQILLYIYGKNH